ncbi:MAG: hypothetical protein RML95_15465, partial [Anaerolineae bacterium]|nr:hypothetical protein [Anaerolineae bacterium]
MPDERLSKVTVYALVTGLVSIGALLLAASLTDWRADLLTIGGVVYFAFLYLLLAALSFPVFGNLRAGTEGTAVLAALFSVGPLGTLLAANLGQLSYEILATLRDLRAQRKLRSLRELLAHAFLNVALISLGTLLAAQVYATLGGKLPLANFEAAQFVECSAALIAYTITVIAPKVALVYYLRGHAEPQSFSWRKL